MVSSFSDPLIDRSGVDIFRRTLLQACDTDIPHAGLEFIFENVNELLDPFLTVPCCEKDWPAKTGSYSPQTNQLQYVRPTTNTAIHEDRERPRRA